jgi:hypothetical protein
LLLCDIVGLQLYWALRLPSTNIYRGGALGFRGQGGRPGGPLPRSGPSREDEHPVVRDPRDGVPAFEWLVHRLVVVEIE